MPSIILFDNPDVRAQLLPFTFTRPVAAIRCGILTLAEKWAHWLQTEVSYATERYLSDLFPFVFSGEQLYIDGALCPDSRLVEVLGELPAESFLRSAKDRSVLAVRTGSATWNDERETVGLKEYIYPGEYVAIRNLWNIFVENGNQIVADYARLTAERTSQPLIDPHTRCYAPENIFIEEGATIRAAILNAEGGPIYIGKNATVSEGAMIQGPFALGEGAVVGQGANIRPNTTVGPYCKVGGEVNNSVFFGYSNKGHDGYLGNSVIGEWCNMGANTNNSNLKNDYTNVKLYNHATQQLEDTGGVFCGLFMGDHTKTGISTMFNTGTVVGVNVNVFGAGFQPKHIPSFTWGGQAEGFAPYRYDKALAVVRETMHRRGEELGERKKAMLKRVYEFMTGPPERF